MAKDPVCGMEGDPDKTATASFGGKTFYLA